MVVGCEASRLRTKRTTIHSVGDGRRAVESVLCNRKGDDPDTPGVILSLYTLASGTCLFSMAMPVSNLT